MAGIPAGPAQLAGLLVDFVCLAARSRGLRREDFDFRRPTRWPG
jgi:hypothetical protein